MYKVLADFADIQDGGYVYHTGDYFPRVGVEATEKRISALKSHTNRLGRPLIEEVKDFMPKPESGEKKPNSPRRRAKKEG